ncbi:MAG: hypothetical protein LBE72_03040, partial [Rickettsia sp.]|nr:hypothetical protein [Rickettsia sp.]
MAEQVDINISTIVDDAQLISLKEELVELMDKVFDIVIDASSADEASDSVDNLADSMDDLSDKSSESLDSVDNLSDSMDNLSDKSAQASDGVKDFSDSQEEATKSTDMLTGALSTLAALGIVEFFKSAAESAAGFERSMNVLSIVSEEAGVSLDATKKTASGLTSEFGLSGGSVRSFVSELTMLGIESQEVIKGLGKSATGVGYLLGDSFDTVNAKIKNAIIKGKIIPKQFGSAFTMIKNSVEESGQSFEEWESKFDSATEPERAIMLNDVLRDTKSIQEAAAKSAQSFDAKMQRLDNTIGGIIRRLGEPALAAFAPIIDGIAWAVGGLVDIWDGLPRPMKDFISGIILVVGAVGGFVAVITAVAAIMPAIIGALGALAGASGAVTLSSIAASLGLSGLGAALMPILGALAPVIGIALAIVGIAIAIQELGKYMGWWEDWGTMIESFQAGISRLWSAFTNNSQVIAFIDNIKSDWASLMEILSPIGEALTNFWNDLFPDNAADEGFDIVRAIIDVFGLLGDAVASVWGFFTENPIGKFIATLLLILNPITLVILWFDELVATFQAVSNFLSNVGGKILDALNTIASFFMNLWSKVTGFFLSSFYDETGKWLGVIPGILNLLFKIGKTILKGILAIPGLILTGLTKLYNIGVSIGESIYNGLSQIPGMIIRAFSNISSWILSALSSAASSTSSAAGSVDWSRILTSLIDFITSIPGQIMSLAKSVFSGGIDVMGAIAGALFGSTGEVNFKSTANKLLNVLFYPSEW